MGFLLSAVYENDDMGTLVVRPKAVPKNFLGSKALGEDDFGGFGK